MRISTVFSRRAFFSAVGAFALVGVFRHVASIADPTPIPNRVRPGGRGKSRSAFLGSNTSRPRMTLLTLSQSSSRHCGQAAPITTKSASFTAFMASLA